MKIVSFGHCFDLLLSHLNIITLFKKKKKRYTHWEIQTIYNILSIARS